ncbi:winged helix-turn-helix transcriptional regulator [Candidatus Saccharibacteria bacterium]|nr:winged helix-turn-helix transcriptional regulator [Candidatus Saccharibacteria bacterium]HPR08961.1 helix-turn-helix domain-containing protein [Candidatus Saccharibacteria bacterium]
MSTQTISVLKALGDEIRLGLVQKVLAQPTPQLTCDIIARCDVLSSLSQPTISHHIAKLVESGVLLESRAGKQKIYTVNEPLLRSLGIDITKL